MSVYVMREPLMTEQQHQLLVQYARACHALALDAEDQAAKQACEEAQQQLISMGWYPCYDDEDDCYLCIPG
jgi:glycerol-3-phosphate cytidylyltransferase-like family protein